MWFEEAVKEANGKKFFHNGQPVLDDRFIGLVDKVSKTCGIEIKEAIVEVLKVHSDKWEIINE